MLSQVRDIVSSALLFLGLLALASCDDWFVRTLDWIDLRSDPAPEIQQKLAADAELARAWRGECPDWESDELLYDFEGSERAFNVVQAAAQMGQVDAIHCMLGTHDAYDADMDEMTAQVDYTWVELARLLGDETVELERYRRRLEPMLTDDLRERSLDVARRFKHHADWAAAQGWPETWPEEDPAD